MDRQLRLVDGTCPSGQAIPDLEAMGEVLGRLERPRLIWLLQNAAEEQRTFVMAKVKVEAIEAQRDRLLAPIDDGERKGLTDDERAALQAIDTAYLAAEEALIALEAPLLAHARRRLWQSPAIATSRPAYAVLLDPSLRGKRDAVLELAAWLGYNEYGDWNTPDADLFADTGTEG